jgi:arabinogalactan endo-1,4-beta-galactosidase
MDWAGYSQSRLEKAIYDYTAQSVRAMRTAGVAPEYVSIGNEINNALADVSRWTSPADYCALLASASKAVGNRSWRWGPATRGRPRRTARARRL